MVFGNLIISQATITPLRYKRKNEPILKSTFVDGSIMNSFATLTFHEQFQTFDDDFYEIFINPPEGCVIYDVKGKFNDKTTEFVVNKLEEPVSNGNYDKNSNSDAINLTLGRISSSTTVSIEITCTFTASLTKLNSYTFYFPTEKKLLNTNFSANIIVNKSQKKTSQIKSSEGKITLKDDHLIISSIKLKSSFHLQFEFPETIESTAFSTKIDRFNYVGLSLHPNSFANNSIIKQEIYLLIDCSGSMKGDKIKYAQAALVNFLHELPKNYYFNILRFGSTFEQMFEHSVENNTKNISDSLKYASMLKADLRGTDIYSPLMSIINENPRKGYVRQVFALTDGEVRTPANVIAICNANRHIMRVFPFGIGDDVNRAFCNELAKSTAAEAHFINIKDISGTVLKTLKSSYVSAVVNAQLHIEGVDSFEFAPQPIPSLFENNLTHVIVRYECTSNANSEFLLINGENGDSTYEETIEIEKNENLINLQKLFAYHNIRDMEDKMMNTRKPGESEKIRQNIVRLSIQSAVVSSFTGMFTVINGVRQKPKDLQKEIDKYQKDHNIEQNKEQQFSKMQRVSSQQQIHKQQPPQMQHQLCQQRMTQKQSRNQQAFVQARAPVLQAKSRWGSSQMQQNRSMSTSPSHIQQQQKKPMIAKQMSLKNLQQKRSALVVSQTQQKNVHIDKTVSYLLQIQQPNGSWNDVSIIKQLVNTKSKEPTIKDLFAEFPSVRKEMRGLNDECVITLIVICWLFSEKNKFLSTFETEVHKGLNFVRRNSNKMISDKISENVHFINGILLKSSS